MDQMADEMTVRGDLTDKGRLSPAEESSTWQRGDRIQSEAHAADWRSGATADAKPEDDGGDTNVQQPRECDASISPLFSLKMYLRRSSSAASSNTDSLSSQPSNMGIDCAGIVLKCLFCQFYDMILMVPASCERAANHCCPSYKQVVSTMPPTPRGEDDSYMDLDCGLLTSCKDANDCLELAMEMSEICYH